MLWCSIYNMLLYCIVQYYTVLYCALLCITVLEELLNSTMQYYIGPIIFYLIGVLIVMYALYVQMYIRITHAAFV